VIARIVDGSRLDEFKARFGETLVRASRQSWACRWDRREQRRPVLGGRAEGRAFRGALLAAEHPAVFLQNITGFMVGRKYENEGIARHGAKMVTAVATTSVPKVTVLVGGSFGAGNYGMAGRAYSPRSCGPGPTPASRDGGRAGGGRAAQVRREGHRAQGRPVVRRGGGGVQAADAGDVRRQSHPLYASRRLWDDGIVDPRRTREVLALSLRRSLNAPIEPTRFGVFRM
jgi:3-methylcrotonyl-CoA carboxylase beta subunit